MSIKTFSWVSYIDFWESVDWWFDYKTWEEMMIKVYRKNVNFIYNISKWDFIEYKGFQDSPKRYKPKEAEKLAPDEILKLNEEFKIYNKDWSLYTTFTPTENQYGYFIWENSNWKEMTAKYLIYNEDKSSYSLYFIENTSWKKLYYFVKDWIKLEESEEWEIFDFSYIPNSTKLIYNIKKYNWQKWCWDFIHWVWSCDSYIKYLVIDNLIFNNDNYFENYSISQDWKQIFIDYSNINRKIKSWLWLILLDWNIEDTYKKVINAYVSIYTDEVKKIKWWNKVINQINTLIPTLNKEKTEKLYIKLYWLKGNPKINKNTLSLVNLILSKLDLHLINHKEFNLNNLDIIKNK